MKFLRSTFYIMRIDGTVELVSGWIDDTHTYGFHPMNKKSKSSNNVYTWKWIATDLKSGLRVTENKTRIKCYNWVQAHQAEIDEQRSLPQYEHYVALKKRRIEYGQIHKALVR